jgi:hypothetical protein
MMYHNFTEQHFCDRGWSQVPTEIKTEMIALMTTDPVPVAGMLDELLGKQWLLDSFHTTQVLVYNESANLEHILAIHEYLRSRACNIENIVLFLTCHVGAADWWCDYVSVNKIRSFRVLETQVHGPWWEQYLMYGDHPVDLAWLKKKRISKLFGYHGGFNPHPEREFMFLFLQSLNLDSRITYVQPNFSSWKFLSGWIERLTYYKRQDIIDRLDIQYQQWCNPWKPIDCDLPYETATWKNYGTNFNPFSDRGLFAQTYRDTWLSMTRESFNRYPFITCTEKLVVPLFYGCVPVGMSYMFNRACDTLKLEIPNGMPDLKYIYNMPELMDRMDAIESFLREMNNVSLDDRQDQYNSNIDVYARNIDWVLGGDLHYYLEKEFVKSCDLIAQQLND